MAGSQQRFLPPIFASPECYEPSHGPIQAGESNRWITVYHDRLIHQDLVVQKQSTGLYPVSLIEGLIWPNRIMPVIVNIPGWTAN